MTGAMNLLLVLTDTFCQFEVKYCQKLSIFWKDNEENSAIPGTVMYSKSEERA